jgi:TPR repeat protein
MLGDPRFFLALFAFLAVSFADLRADELAPGNQGGDEFLEYERSTKSKKTSNNPTELRGKAEGGDSLAQYEYAIMLIIGRGMPRDVAQGVEWLKRAAKRGEADAQYLLGLYHVDGSNGMKKDIKEAKKWLSLAADSGKKEAEFLLGRLFYEEKKYIEAMPWLERAAKQNFLRANTYIGVMHLRGWGVTKNEAKGIEWIRQAAEKKDATALMMLGNLSSLGEGMAKDDNAAFKFYLAASERNNHKAMQFLGLAYRDGKGVTADADKAADWLAKSVKLGRNREAYDALISLELNRKNAKAVRYLEEIDEKGLMGYPVFDFLKASTKTTPLPCRLESGEIIQAVYASCEQRGGLVERGANDRLVRCKIGEHNIRVNKNECQMVSEGRLVVCEAPADGKLLKEKTVVQALETECASRHGRVVQGRVKQTILTSRGVTMGLQKNEPAKAGTGTGAAPATTPPSTSFSPDVTNPKPN